MAFIKFTEPGRSLSPRISIRSSGVIVFNSGVISKFGLQNTEHVVLLYDPDEKKIGIKPCSGEETGAHKLHKGRTSAYVPSRKFASHYGLAPDRTRRYEAAWDTTHEMIVVDLKKS